MNETTRRNIACTLSIAVNICIFITLLSYLGLTNLTICVAMVVVAVSPLKQHTLPPVLIGYGVIGALLGDKELTDVIKQEYKQRKNWLKNWFK